MVAGASRMSTALQSFSQQISSVGHAVTGGRFGDAGDGKLFDAKKGEISELREELCSTNREKKKTAVKKVIAAMTLGKDMSSMFPEVVNCMQTTNLELKKLVYLYVINFARSRPELAILAVNTFRKDTLDTNPLVRALAIRTMGCIRLPQIVEYLVEPLKRCCRDPDPYVRKSAAICVGKLFDTCPSAADDFQFVDVLKGMATDSNPMVVANAIATLSEISEVTGQDHLGFTSDSGPKLIVGLADCSEWGQVIILDVLSLYYNPSTSREAELCLERLLPRLGHANPAVILSTVKLLINLSDRVVNNQSLVDTVTKRCFPPLISILASETSEVQYVVLRNLQLIHQKWPKLLGGECRAFFAKFSDPVYVKLEKLNMLVLTCTPSNLSLILQELKEYSSEVDIEFARRTIRAIGRIALTVPQATEPSVRLFTEMLESRGPFAVEEICIVIRDIVRYFPKQFDRFFQLLLPLASQLEDPEAKAAFIWMLGEFVDQVPNIKDTLPLYFSSFLDESLQVQLQILTASLKACLRQPQAARGVCFNLLKIAAEECDHPDIRDRALIYWRLLSASPQVAKEVIFSAKPSLGPSLFTLNENMLEILLRNLGMMASVYHAAPATFAARLRDNHSAVADNGDDFDEVEDETALADRVDGVRPASSTTTEIKRRLEERNMITVVDDDEEEEEQETKKRHVNKSIDREDSTTDDDGPPADPRPIPPRNLLLPASANSPVQIEGCITRMNQTAVLLMRVINKSSSVINSGNQLTISTESNSFGLSPTQKIMTKPSIPPNTHQDIAVPLSPGVNLSSAPPPCPPAVKISIQFNNSTSQQQINIPNFEVPFDISAVFIERRPVDKEVFKSHWTRMGEQKQASLSGVTRLRDLTAESAQSRLKSFNIRTVALNSAPNHSLLHLSAVTCNQLLILFQIGIQANGPGVKFSVRSDAAILMPCLTQSVSSILGVTTT